MVTVQLTKLLIFTVMWQLQCEGRLTCGAFVILGALFKRHVLNGGKCRSKLEDGILVAIGPHPESTHRNSVFSKLVGEKGFRRLVQRAVLIAAGRLQDNEQEAKSRETQSAH